MVVYNWYACKSRFIYWIDLSLILYAALFLFAGWLHLQPNFQPFYLGLKMQNLV